MNRTQRKDLQQAWKEWMGCQDVALFVTLNFNRDTSIAACRAYVKEFAARLDRYWLGRNWCRYRSRDRLDGIGVLEHPNSNLHVHLLMRLPAPAQQLQIGIVDRVIEEKWISLVPSGSCDVQSIHSMDGVASYLAKDLHLAGRTEHTIILSEFHSERSGKGLAWATPYRVTNLSMRSRHAKRRP